MTPIVWGIITVISLLLGFGVAWALRRSSTPNGGADNPALNLLQNQINELTRAINDKFSEQTRTVGDSLKTQFSESQRMMTHFVKEVTHMTERATRWEETGKQIIGFAEQLQNLENILKNPKQRGILGEYYLETLLKNALPPGSYQMQYKFTNGEIVDAIVLVRDKIIPIDSKFSLENYNRLAEERNEVEKDRLGKLFVSDLKLRIQETAKYIRPEENTLEFAFMFIPHEAIYYDLLINKIGGAGESNDSLIQWAASKHKVIIVSPTSFLAYLQTVLQGLKALQIEEQAKNIIKRVEELGKHLKSYEEYHGKLGNALGTVVNHYNHSGKELKKVDKDIYRISGEAVGLETPVLDKPEIGE
jgi:DNA recombination protein RmuC